MYTKPLTLAGRYQVVNGLEQLLYAAFAQHRGVARAATVAMRLGNNFLGSVSSPLTRSIGT